MAGIALNEDNSHYFATRAGQALDAETVAAWVDQYADTQVLELMLCPSAMRTSYGSKVWQPIWHGYDPNGPDDQPLLASLSSDQRTQMRRWVHTAWKLHADGIDPYAVWIDRARERGIRPWLSMRMNDIHSVDDEQNVMHSDRWRQRPDLRRVTYRQAGPWQDRAFDYGRAEVREHHMALIRELAERYDFDGLELDWMRFGFHFRPGHEAEGCELLTAFTTQVRNLLDEWQQRRGHEIKLGARVPSRPQTARDLGMDGVRWAREGLLDMLVVTPFWASTEPDMPIEVWRKLLDGAKTTLAAGLEINVRPFPGAEAHRNSSETTRGAAAGLLERGAQRVYLFNYMDSDTAMADMANYRTMLCELGSLETLAGKPRRHVLTYPDTWPPGVPQPCALPADCAAGSWRAFRLPTGPKPEGAEATVVLGIAGNETADTSEWDVRVNCELCAPLGPIELPEPRPSARTCGFRLPPAAMHAGDSVIEFCPGQDVRIEWVEVRVGA